MGHVIYVGPTGSMRRAPKVGATQCHLRVLVGVGAENFLTHFNFLLTPSELFSNPAELGPVPMAITGVRSGSSLIAMSFPRQPQFLLLTSSFSH